MKKDRYIRPALGGRQIPGRFDGDGLAVVPVKFRETTACGLTNDYLLVSTGCFMTMYIVHGLTVELCAVFRRRCAARGHSPVVALAIVEMMIDVAVEMIRPVIPGASADEDPAAEPLGPIIAIRSAVVRRSLVIPVGANRRYSNADSNLCMRFINGRK